MLWSVPGFAQNSVTTIERAPEPTFDTPRAVTKTTSKEAQDRFEFTVGDVAARSPGVQIQTTNRGAETILIRGFVGPENLILVDGLRFNQGTFRTGPNQYLALLPLQLYGGVEVLRGPSGVLFGASTSGGVINLDPDIPLGTEARISFDSATETTRASGVSSIEFEKLANLKLTLGATYEYSGGLRAGSGDEFLFASTSTSGDVIAPSFYRGGFTFGASVSPVDDFTLEGRYFGAFTNGAPRTDRLGQGEVRFNDNIDHFAYLRARTEIFGSTDFDIGLVFHQTREDVRRINCQTVTRFDEENVPFSRVANAQACADQEQSEVARIRNNKDVVTTVGLSMTGVAPIYERASIKFGADLYADTVDSEADQASAPEFVFTPRSRGNFSEVSTYLVGGVFAAPTWTAISSGSHAIELTAGVRYEFARALAKDVPGLGEVDYTFSSPIGSASVSYLYDTNAHIYLSWNQGFRIPNLQETTVLGDTGNNFEIPNDDLDPERTDAFELGAKLEFAGFKIEPTLFATLIRDRITREEATFEGEAEIDGKTVVRRVNRDSGYLYGAEIAAEGPQFFNVTPYGSIALLDGAVTTDRSEPNFDEGPLHDIFAGSDSYENLRRLPPTSYEIGVRYDATEHLSATAYVRGAFGQTRVPPGDRGDLRICEASPGEFAIDCEGTEGWATVNATGRFQTKHFALDLGLLNITDTRYRQHGSGVPAPGRSVVGQLTLKY